MESGFLTGLLIILLGEVLAGLWLAGSYILLKKQKAQQKLRSTEAQIYERVLSEGQQEVHILVRRSDLCPIYLTGNFQSMLGIRPERLRDDVTLLRTLNDRLFNKSFLTQYEAWDGVAPIAREFQHQQSKRWLQLKITRSADTLYDLWVFYDVTEAKEKVTALETELGKAEEASKSKTTFLSKMSHEIRTPMNGVIGMLTLADAQLDGSHPAKVYLTKAGELSQFLLSLINDILDMSRIEAGKIEIEEKEFSITGLADKLRNMFQKNIEAKGVHFEVEVLDFDVDYLIGDELRLSQVIVNFLSNAQKFTSEGEIRVTFRQMLKEGDKANFMVRVHDTGIGMAPSFISRIFKPFEQESADVTKKYGGTGLGMAITDQIVSLMGGEIVIDSLPGRGSDFTVYIALPIAQGHEGMEAAVATRHQEEEVIDFTYEGARILMAEDNEINSEIAVNILKMKGAAFVEVARNGKQVVDMFAAQPPQYYDFILMDIQMPVMNGREATKTIRRMERRDAKQIPIFALSADAFVEDRRKSEAVGMNGHFAKPIDFEEVRIGIGRYLKETKTRGQI